MKKLVSLYNMWKYELLGTVVVRTGLSITEGLPPFKELNGNAILPPFSKEFLTCNEEHLRRNIRYCISIFIYNLIMCSDFPRTKETTAALNNFESDLRSMSSNPWIELLFDFGKNDSSPDLNQLLPLIDSTYRYNLQISRPVFENLTSRHIEKLTTLLLEDRPRIGQWIIHKSAAFRSTQ